MRRRSAARALLAAVATLAVVLGTAACGDQEKAYCSALSADQETFAAMADDTSGLALLDHRAMLQKLADKAPNDLSDEWQTFLGAVDAFDQVLRDVGVKPGDFVDGRPPAGLAAADRTRISDAASELSSPDVVDAANGIEQQAKDVCKLQLGL